MGRSKKALGRGKIRCDEVAARLESLGAALASSVAARAAGRGLISRDHFSEHA